MASQTSSRRTSGSAAAAGVEMIQDSPGREGPNVVLINAAYMSVKLVEKLALLGRSSIAVDAEIQRKVGSMDALCLAGAGEQSPVGVEHTSPLLQISRHNVPRKSP